MPAGNLDPHKGMKDTKNGNYIGKYKGFVSYLLDAPLKKVTDYLN